MAADKHYDLIQDRRGMIWDLLLYVPTVLALLSIGIKLWFGPDQTWAYMLFFMASFFFITGANRILGGRMMLLPGAPVAIEVGKLQVTLTLKSGQRVDLVKDVRYFADYAGKSLGLSGMDVNGKKRQYVLHRGQFDSTSTYNDLRGLLNVYK
jgi:hypothetical protein